MQKKNKIGQHQTIMKELKPALKWLQSLCYVDRVILNRTECARHAYPPGHIRYQMPLRGGIRIKGYGGTGIIDIYIKTDEPERLIKAIAVRYEV